MCEDFNFNHYLRIEKIFVWEYYFFYLLHPILYNMQNRTLVQFNIWPHEWGMGEHSYIQLVSWYKYKRGIYVYVGSSTAYYVHCAHSSNYTKEKNMEKAVQKQFKKPLPSKPTTRLFTLKTHSNASNVYWMNTVRIVLRFIYSRWMSQLVGCRSGQTKKKRFTLLFLWMNWDRLQLRSFVS